RREEGGRQQRGGERERQGAGSDVGGDDAARAKPGDADDRIDPGGVDALCRADQTAGSSDQPGPAARQPPDRATPEQAGRVAAAQVRLWRVRRNVPGAPEDEAATLREWDGVSGCAQMCMRSSARSIPNKGSRSWKN